MTTPAEPQVPDVPDEGADVVEPEPTPEPEPAPELTEPELLAIATPSTVRRAPKFRPFVFTGLLVGIVLGLLVVWLATVLTGDDTSSTVTRAENPGLVRWWLAVAGAAAGATAGGVVAVLADQRSLRRARRAEPTDD